MLTSDEFVARMTALIRRGAKVRLVMEANEAWTVMAFLQLALRHPGSISNAGSPIARLVTWRILEQLVEANPSLRSTAEAGFNPAEDEDAPPWPR